jgi:hypothetical protein
MHTESRKLVARPSLIWVVSACSEARVFVPIRVIQTPCISKCLELPHLFNSAFGLTAAVSAIYSRILEIRATHALDRIPATNIRILGALTRSLQLGAHTKVQLIDAIIMGEAKPHEFILACNLTIWPEHLIIATMA